MLNNKKCLKNDFKQNKKEKHQKANKKKQNEHMTMRQQTELRQLKTNKLKKILSKKTQNTNSCFIKNTKKGGKYGILCRRI